jgi:hypothetical protein
MDNSLSRGWFGGAGLSLVRLGRTRNERIGPWVNGSYRELT